MILGLILKALLIWGILSFLDYVFGNTVWPSKTGVVQVDVFDKSNNPAGIAYAVYKIYRVCIFFKVKYWFKSPHAIDNRDLLVDSKHDNRSIYTIMSLLETYYHSNILSTDFNDALLMHESRKDLAILIAKMYADEYDSAEPIKDRSNPTEIWSSSGYSKVKENVRNEEDELTLQLGEAIMANNQDKVDALMHVLRSKNYLPKLKEKIEVDVPRDN